MHATLCRPPFAAYELSSTLPSQDDEMFLSLDDPSDATNVHSYVPEDDWSNDGLDDDLLLAVEDPNI
jgi:hypothetical protein